MLQRSCNMENTRQNHIVILGNILLGVVSQKAVPDFRYFKI